MESFSERQGITTKKVIQLESMDDDLRNSLWNILHDYFWKNSDTGIRGDFATKELDKVIDVVWKHKFKKPIDEKRRYIQEQLEDIKDIFNQYEWNEVYDFIKFMLPLVDYIPRQITNKYIATCNIILERENSAYRFVGEIIAPITNRVEISEIEKALISPHDVVRIHVEEALRKLSDKENPDYRNSIKESISAVESVVRLIDKNPNATLSSAIGRVKSKIQLHDDLERGFKSIYDYTSDEGGIRHSLMDEPNLTSDDARFMLVSCSAFANYLLRLAEKAKILPRSGGS